MSAFSTCWLRNVKSSGNALLKTTRPIVVRITGVRPAHSADSPS